MKKIMISTLALGAIVIGGFSITSFANEDKIEAEPIFKVISSENNTQAVSDQELSSKDLKDYTREEMLQYCIDKFNLTEEEAKRMKSMMNSGGCH
ncbi:MAG: hypothetical protein ACRDA3_15355 [Peptostreptococcaceae bacterium]